MPSISLWFDLLENQVNKICILFGLPLYRIGSCLLPGHSGIASVLHDTKQAESGDTLLYIGLVRAAKIVMQCIGLCMFLNIPS